MPSPKESPPSPPPPPSIPLAPHPPTIPVPPRLTYLIGRLRNRTITLEEATEMFELQQEMIHQMALRSMTSVAAASSPVPSSSSEVPSTTSSRGYGPQVIGNDDALAATLLLFGVGAGLLAALVKRIPSGDTYPSSPSRGPSSTQ